VSVLVSVFCDLAQTVALHLTGIVRCVNIGSGIRVSRFEPQEGHASFRSFDISDQISRSGSGLVSTGGSDRGFH
jgi:hypothetical protein